MPQPKHPPEIEQLLRASPSKTTPLLLELARAQAARRRPAELLAQMDRDGFVAPSMLDLRLIHELDGLALASAEDFEAVQLSPVAPLGQCAVLAPTSQDRTLTALRGTEVVSDPTNTLALLAARRLIADPRTDVRLCTVHQVLRAQALPPEPGFSRHFRLFALAQAGPARPNEDFEATAVTTSIARFDALLDAAASIGCKAPRRRATILAAEHRQTLAARIRERLHDDLPHLVLEDAPLDSRYYDGLRVLLWAEATDGQSLPIGDTGVFDWVARLTSNHRLRLVASGLGIQLLPLRFRG